MRLYAFLSLRSPPAAAAATVVARSPPPRRNPRRAALHGGRYFDHRDHYRCGQLQPLVGNSCTDDWITDLMPPRLLTIDSNGNKRSRTWLRDFAPAT